MNILHIGKFYPPYHGGMEHYLCDLAREQVQQGHQVTVVVHNHQWQTITAKKTTEVIDGVQVIRMRSLRPILFAPLMIGLNKQVKQIFQHEKPDIVHLHGPNPSLFMLLLNKLVKEVPWVFSWHSDMVTSNSRWLMKLIYPFIKPIENRLIKQADCILVSTQDYADHSQQLIKHADKTLVVPLGLRTQELDAMDEMKRGSGLAWAKEQWPDDKFKVFNLGRLTFYKNQKMLLDAMPLTHNCHLLIAGDGPLKNSLSQQIDQMNLADKVGLLGSQSWYKIHALYDSCDVFCMASNDRAESFGVVLLEAMYHNKIILVPDTVGSGMRWLADNYNKGFVYENNNPKDFARKIDAIQQKFATLSEQPNDFNYHMTEIVEVIEQHYLKTLTRRSS